jgi:6-pyruvoyltetrahydropterin/6-carboxytetrahydropterin synthase
MPYEVIRSHEICAGHRVVGHESKCRHLHGHNYVFHFHVAPQPEREAVHIDGGAYVAGEVVGEGSLDNIGRVIDFSVVKSTLCEWLETHWDHRFLHWEKDELMNGLAYLAQCDAERGTHQVVTGRDYLHFSDSLVALPFNPTAENLAQYMVEVIGPRLLDEHGVELVKCTIEETSKCHVGYTK